MVSTGRALYPGSGSMIGLHKIQVVSQASDCVVESLRASCSGTEQNCEERCDHASMLSEESEEPLQKCHDHVLMLFEESHGMFNMLLMRIMFLMGLIILVRFISYMMGCCI